MIWISIKFIVFLSWDWSYIVVYFSFLLKIFDNEPSTQTFCTICDMSKFLGRIRPGPKALSENINYCLQAATTHLFFWISSPKALSENINYCLQAATTHLFFWISDEKSDSSEAGEVDNRSNSNGRRYSLHPNNNNFQNNGRVCVC
jgi:hypothetical protein